MNLDTWKTKIKAMLIHYCESPTKDKNKQFIDAVVDLLASATEDYHVRYPEQIRRIESAAHYSNCPVLEGKATRCDCKE